MNLQTPVPKDSIDLRKGPARARQHEMVTMEVKLLVEVTLSGSDTLRLPLVYEPFRVTPALEYHNKRVGVHILYKL